MLRPHKHTHALSLSLSHLSLSLQMHLYDTSSIAQHLKKKKHIQAQQQKYGKFSRKTQQY